MRHFSLVILAIIGFHSSTFAQLPEPTARTFKRTKNVFTLHRAGFLSADETPFVVSTIVGALLTDHFAAGIGGEYDSYEHGAIVPLLLTLRANTSNRIVSPTFSLELAYLKSTQTNRFVGWRDGVGVALGTGAEAYLSNRFALQFEINGHVRWHETNRWYGASKDRATGWGFTFGVSYHPKRAA